MSLMASVTVGFAPPGGLPLPGGTGAGRLAPTAPLSRAAPLGCDSPRGSVAGQSAPAGGPWSNAAPSVAIAIVCVGPPLSASGASFGSASAPGQFDAGKSMLCPLSVIVPEQLPPVFDATIVFWRPTWPANSAIPPSLPAAPGVTPAPGAPAAAANRESPPPRPAAPGVTRARGAPGALAEMVLLRKLIAREVSAAPAPPRPPLPVATLGVGPGSAPPRPARFPLSVLFTTV